MREGGVLKLLNHINVGKAAYLDDLQNRVLKFCDIWATSFLSSSSGQYTQASFQRLERRKHHSS
ncbi:hypothetical protein DPMN_160221 [Dreissena polymorpha]|uniref:Uncharacterized protein n=1 Tax=Dreissena polymorpha TaxID=45954 RepID=A0A9D4EMT7_DREPO|nr:hypothetical protein DPMN_160221 [Dreissena polymorpha]